MGTHDLIVTYRNTEAHDFPLVLVIGREPNNPAPFTATSGPYDLDQPPGCGFRDTAYAAVGAPDGLKSAVLKRQARVAGASPIAFTDAAPVPTSLSDPATPTIRGTITQTDIRRHVDQIAGMKHILDRTRLVLISAPRSGNMGALARENADASAAMLAELFDSLSISHLGVPFICRSNQPAIVSRILGDATTSSSIQETMKEFENHFGLRDVLEAA